MTCPHPAPTQHGYIEISGFTGEYRPGTRARYHCSPGYQITGEDSRVCTGQGWSGEIPQCAPLPCGDPPSTTMVANADMAVLEPTVVTFTCQPGYSTGDPAVTEFQSSCDSSGNWSAVTQRCSRDQPGYQFGEDPRKDFLVLIISGIFLIIAVSSIALASRLIIIRAQTKRGFFLRNPNYQAATPGPPESLKPLTCDSEELPAPGGTPARKNSQPATPKKVSLILKIEEEKKQQGSSSTPVVQSVVVGGGGRPALRYQPGPGLTTASQQSSPVNKARSVQLCVMSHSYSSLPLPESNLTLVGSTNFATLTRRPRREKTGLGNLRHSRTFSTFQPVQLPQVKPQGRLHQTQTAESSSEAAVRSSAKCSAVSQGEREGVMTVD